MLNLSQMHFKIEHGVLNIDYLKNPIKFSMPDIQPALMKKPQIILVHPVSLLSAFLYTFAARYKNTGLNNFFTNKKQGNEQLRIDGDFYPCAF